MWWDRALSIFLNVLGPNHGHTLAVQRNLSRCVGWGFPDGDAADQGEIDAKDGNKTVSSDENEMQWRARRLKLATAFEDQSSNADHPDLIWNRDAECWIIKLASGEKVSILEAPSGLTGVILLQDVWESRVSKAAQQDGSDRPPPLQL